MLFLIFFHNMIGFYRVSKVLLSLEAWKSIVFEMKQYFLRNYLKTNTGVQRAILHAAVYIMKIHRGACRFCKQALNNKLTSIV